MTGFAENSGVLWFFVRDTAMRIPPFVNHKGKDVNSHWLADQWDERSVLGHAQSLKGMMKSDDYPEIHTAQTPKRLDGRLILQDMFRRISERLSLLVSRTIF